MIKQKMLIRNISLQIATAGVSGLLLASPALAQSDSNDPDKQANQSKSQEMEQAIRAEFKQLDRNSDGKLQWDEIQPRLEQSNLKDQWDQDKLMSEYDESDNDALELQEYQRFLIEAGVVGTQTEQTTRAQTEQQRETDQQQREEVEVESADVEVDPGQPEVEVTQKSPDVQVQQAEADVSVERQPPQVTVRQPAPEVTVTQPEPDVQVRMPEPEVEVTQQDPNVNVDQGQPNVQVEQQQPEVTVTRGEPEVEVEEQQPDVVLKRDEPDVTLADSEQQASVQTDQEDEQAQVQVEQSEPQVEVSQAEPEVAVETAEQADVNVERENQEQAQGEQQERDQEIAGEDSEPSEQQQAQQQSTLDGMSIDDLKGLKVVNADGRLLGEADQVVVSEEQGNAGVLLSMGGFLGIGAKQVMAPLDELSVEGDRLVWKTSQTEDELKQSADDQEDSHREVSSNDYQTVGELKQSNGQ